MQVKIIADSCSHEGKRIITFQLRYPRFIHSEVMTHRVFSRNASSSRAIPVIKLINQVEADPAMPVHWGKNQAGMQAWEEVDDETKELAREAWLIAAKNAVESARFMAVDLNLHKQVVNRILEPFQFIEVVLTATSYDNFFELRHHEDADPTIFALTALMKAEIQKSTPVLLGPNEWHLPYITDAERERYSTDILLQVSAARCCRVSYLRHDGEAPDVQKDIRLCEKLVGSEPLHASPFEHQATPDIRNPWLVKLFKGEWQNKHLHGNFDGFVQHRKLIELQFKEAA